MMSVVSEYRRRAVFSHSMRRMYSSRVYSRSIAASTCDDPDCTGRCT